MTLDLSELRFRVPCADCEVSALLLKPRSAMWLFVMAHGAGAGIGHPFMQDLSARLAEFGIATFRYQFPYMERGQRRPDPAAVLIDTIRHAVATASSAAPGLPLLAGGKSMGGRLTSVTQAEEPLPVVRGLVFLGFPLHPTGKPSSERGAHLPRIDVPMLFLQGSRDSMGELDLIRPLCDRLGPRVTLHVLEDADHSFHVPKRTGRRDADVMEEAARTVAGWSATFLPGRQE